MTRSRLSYKTITDHLVRLYQCQPFVRRGIAHPVVALHPSDSQVYDIDSLLDPWRPAPEARDFAAYDYSYLHDLQNSKPALYNGATFTLKRIQKNPLKLRGQIGSYFDMLATCAAFERELDAAAAAGMLRAPARTTYHRQVSPSDALIYGDRRSAAIGIGALTVFNDGREYRAILARRSQATAFDSNMFHVLPAMMFGPTTARFSNRREWSVKHQILREVLEELFGMPEETSPHRWDFFYDHPALQYLLSLLERGEAQLCATGIILNLLTLRPEISALLLIHDPAWYARVTAADSETPLVTADETLSDSVVMAPIATDDEFLSRFPPDLHLSMPAQATATMWLGIDRARREIAKSVWASSPGLPSSRAIR
ncbi:MAG: hypothetical protein OXI77_01595 [Chloroflexota bacterium]|nr:hypothetical protein [Chloroflexota bacterium]MDE2910737.1 hypothetical protein [Chloroflexota bacterium]